MSEWTLPDGEGNGECCACAGTELPTTLVSDGMKGDEEPMCWTCYRSSSAGSVTLGVSGRDDALDHLQTRHIIVGVLWANGMELAGVRRKT